MANWLSTAAPPGGQNLSDADFWYAAAEKLLAPLLFAAVKKGGDIGAVATWLDKGIAAKEEVEEILSPEEEQKGEEEGDAASPEQKKEAEEMEAARLAWEANWHRESRQRS